MKPDSYEARVDHWMSKINWRRMDRHATGLCSGIVILCAGELVYAIIAAIIRAVR